MADLMTKQELLDRLAEEEPESLQADGLDDAIIGAARQFNRTLVLYDYNKAVEVFMKQGMTYEEAVEWMEFNVVGAWVGEYTPLFLTHRVKDDESERA